MCNAHITSVGTARTAYILPTRMPSTTTFPLLLWNICWRWHPNQVHRGERQTWNFQSNLAKRSICLTTGGSCLRCSTHICRVCVLLCVNLLSPTFTSLLSAREPITWSRTNKIVVGDSIDLDTTIFYVSPCEVLEELRPSEELRVQCRQLFETSFLQSINKLCTEVNQPAPIAEARPRPKRFVISLTGLAIVTVIGMLASTGVHVWTHQRLKYLEERANVVKRTLHEFENPFPTLEVGVGRTWLPDSKNHWTNGLLFKLLSDLVNRDDIRTSGSFTTNY